MNPKIYLNKAKLTEKRFSELFPYPNKFTLKKYQFSIHNSKQEQKLINKTVLVDKVGSIVGFVIESVSGTGTNFDPKVIKFTYYIDKELVLTQLLSKNTY